MHGQVNEEKSNKEKEIIEERGRGEEEEKLWNKNKKKEMIEKTNKQTQQ